MISEHLKLQPGERVLDLGCGTGRLSMELLTRVGSGGTVIGLDPNEERILAAQAKVSEEMNNLAFIHGMCSDAVGLGPFDAVFSNYVMHWIHDHPTTFKQLFDCLKPGGRLVFLTAGSKLPTLLESTIKLATGQDCCTLLGITTGSVDYWESQCVNAGLSVEFSEDLVLCPKMPSIEAFFKAVSAVSSGVFKSSMLTEQNIRDLCDRHGFRRNSEIVVEMPVVKILAKKLE